MPEEAAGRGRARSVPWLPTLLTGLQGLAALLMVVKWVCFSVEEQKRETCVHNTSLQSDITGLPLYHIPYRAQRCRREPAPMTGLQVEFYSKDDTFARG